MKYHESGVGAYKCIDTEDRDGISDLRKSAVQLEGLTAMQWCSVQSVSMKGCSLQTVKAAYTWNILMLKKTTQGHINYRLNTYVASGIYYMIFHSIYFFYLKQNSNNLGPNDSEISQKLNELFAQ